MKERCSDNIFCLTENGEVVCFIKLSEDSWAAIADEDDQTLEEVLQEMGYSQLPDGSWMRNPEL